MSGKNASRWKIRPCNWAFFEISDGVIPPDYNRFRGDVVYLRSGSRQTIAHTGPQAIHRRVYLRSGSRQTIASKSCACWMSAVYLRSGSRQTIASAVSGTRIYRSVSQKRFPANHSLTQRWEHMQQSVSQKRFPANHSLRVWTPRKLRVYLRSGSRQTIATTGRSACATSEKRWRMGFFNHKSQIANHKSMNRQWRRGAARARCFSIANHKSPIANHSKPKRGSSE